MVYLWSAYSLKAKKMLAIIREFPVSFLYHFPFIQQIFIECLTMCQAPICGAENSDAQNRRTLEFMELTGSVGADR